MFRSDDGSDVAYDNTLVIKKEPDFEVKVEEEEVTGLQAKNESLSEDVTGRYIKPLIVAFFFII